MSGKHDWERIHVVNSTHSVWKCSVCGDSRVTEKGSRPAPDAFVRRWTSADEPQISGCNELVVKAVMES